jgi:hypothetical protein
MSISFFRESYPGFRATSDLESQDFLLGFTPLDGLWHPCSQSWQHLFNNGSYSQCRGVVFGFCNTLWL